MGNMARRNKRGEGEGTDVEGSRGEWKRGRGRGGREEGTDLHDPGSISHKLSYGLMLPVLQKIRLCSLYGKRTSVLENIARRLRRVSPRRRLRIVLYRHTSHRPSFPITILLHHFLPIPAAFFP